VITEEDASEKLRFRTPNAAVYGRVGDLKLVISCLRNTLARNREADRIQFFQGFDP
jgi:hypothetical protein